jgi:hypothetical protein
MGPYGLEYTGNAVFLRSVGRYFWAMVFLFGFCGSFDGPGRGLAFFAMLGIPTAGCALASAFLRNRARWKRQAEEGHAVQSIGIIPLAVAIALGRDLEAIDLAEAEADRIAAGREKCAPEAGKTGHTPLYFMFRTLEVLCWLLTVGMAVVCLFLVQVVGAGIFLAFLIGMASFYGAKVCTVKAVEADAKAESKARHATMAAEAAEGAPLKREQEARVIENDGLAGNGRRAISLADYHDADFPSTRLH